MLAEKALAQSPASTGDSATSVDHLSCEYLTNPLGIDLAKPRMSWIIESTNRGEMQTAYQVVVASSKENLDRDLGDLWDSGEVSSDQSSLVEYGGNALPSRLACWWKVRVWDNSGSGTHWSKPASWEMGLLQPDDWQAKWIEAPVITQGKPLPGKLAIAHASYEAVDGTGAKDVTDLVSGMAVDNTLKVPVDRYTFRNDPFPNHAKRLVVTYTIDGAPHDVTAAENTTLDLPEGRRSLPCLRKDFTLDKPISKARLYATALGLYELRLNGQRVGDHIFAPDWTDYSKRSRYQVYDVTSLLKPGANTLAGMVANGWYSGHIGNGGFQAWGRVPALFAQLEITHPDGSADCIVTDASWKKHAGPISSADNMLGEDYDARQEIAGWDQPGLDVSDWVPVTERTEKQRPLDGQVDGPVRQTGELHPVSRTEAKPGHWIFDLGQNMVGFVRLKISAPAGTQLILRHGEMLDPDGALYTANLCGAAAVDTYICKGGGVEMWQPRFTFHGFRYVELTGLPQAPADDTVTGIVIGTDLPITGKFACSNPEINQLQSNIQWGMRGNYLSVPTDCPQRDERMGWMGDAQVFIRTAAYNGNIAPFFTKWLVDVDDAQSSDGVYSLISPKPGSHKYGKGGTAAWSDAGVICPWTIYLMYGDKRILEQHLPAMMRWIDWCQAHSTNLIRDHDRGPDYGDWLSQGEHTPKDLIGTAYFAYSTSLVAKACEAIGDTTNAAKYGQLFDRIKAAFDQHYITDDGHVRGGTQCAYSLVLRFNLLPDDLRPKAAHYLEEDVQAHQDHLTTGFVGVSYLLPALGSEDKIGTAYRLLLQDTFPSWLFSVKHGATTIWERWDGWTPEKGFQSPKMNSFNHYSLGSCGEWMFDTVAGIEVDPDRPGFKHIVIHPRTGGDLTHAEGSIGSVYGEISAKWKLEKGNFSLDVSIPPNTTATVELPTKSVSSVQESGHGIVHEPEIKPVLGDHENAQLLIGAGDYHFTCPSP